MSNTPLSPAARRPAAGASPSAVSVALRGLWKSYDVGPAHRAARIVVLRDAGLRIARGDVVAIHGVGAGPLTFLRCLAGLVTPDAGTVAWRDARDRIAPPPTRALVAADWRPAADCLTVRDVLELSAAHAPCARRAARPAAAVAAAERRCELLAVRDARVVTLPPVERWRVGLAAAVATGADWIMLELPREPVLAAAWSPHDRGAPLAVRRALVALRADGRTIVAAAGGGRTALVPATRALHWDRGQPRAVAPARRARVAEPRPGR